MKIKTQEVKKKILKSLKLDKNGKKVSKDDSDETKKPIFEDEPVESDDDNESLDSEQEVLIFN
jgi:hypothetical protein